MISWYRKADKWDSLWLKKLIDFQGAGIGCEDRKQNQKLGGKQGLREGGVSQHLRELWEVKKKFQKLFEGI